MEVKVEDIRTLQIVTKTHELLLDEAPEEFLVRAYDDKGNEFSTLDGIVFKWDAKERDDVVKFINFRDSAYDFDYAITSHLIEAKGQQGHKVLLEGIKTGSCKVSVRLVSKVYSEKVSPAVTSVVVVANLYLVPQSAYVMVGGIVSYRAEQIKSNKIQEIALSSSRQYYLQITDPKKAATISSQSIKGNALGATTVTLQDKNVDATVMDEGVRRPSSELHVVVPDHITINIDPHKSWIVIVGNKYDIFVEVFDSDNHRLFPSENWVVKLEVESAFFKVSERAANGSFIQGTPVKFGVAEVHASLIGIRDLVTKEVLRLEKPLLATAELDIFDPIVITPEKSVFPWNPVKPISEQVPYAIKNLRGTAKNELQFAWSSGNSSIATVTQNGVAKTTGLYSGSTEIIASMSKAIHNKGFAEIIVLPALDLNILKNNIILEAEVDQTLNVPVAVYADRTYRKMPFTKCLQLPYKVLLENQDSFSVLHERAEPKEEGCTNIQLKAHQIGFAKLSVEYRYINENRKIINLRDTATIAAFNPLTPLQPSSGTTLLAIDSSLQIAWTGGPNPWTAQGQSHFVDLSIGDDKVVEVKKREPSLSKNNANIYVYETRCRKLGDTTVTLTVGHKISTTLPKPIISTSTITISCGQPEKIQLKADVLTPEYESKCPLIAKSGRIAVQCYEDLPVRIFAFDKEGRRFDNISTLNIGWKVSDDELGTLSSDKGVIFAGENEKNHLGYKFANAEFAHQLLHTKGKAGNLDISATLQKSGSWTTGFSSTLTDTLTLNLIEDAQISPNALTIFHHPSNKAKVNIIHGSGYFDVSLAHKVAVYEYNANDQAVEISPILHGETKVIVKDLCLRTKQVAEASISVVSVHKVDLIVDDKVQKGNTIIAKVRLIDQNGMILAPNSEFLDISVVPTQKTKQSILSIGRGLKKSTSEELMFSVQGTEVGTMALSAVANSNISTVTSLSKNIQVFPPIRLEPRNITLLIGARFQIRATGGPNQPDSQIEYTIENKGSKIATANPIGIVTGLTLGYTKVTGRIMGVDKLTNERSIVSEDTVHIYVVKLNGIKISSPIVRMKVNTDLPLAAVGASDPVNQNAYAFGSANPKLVFNWSTSNGEVADLKSVFHANGVSNHGTFNTATIRLQAKKPGRVLIKLKAKITSSIDNINQYQFDRDEEFKDQLEIHVYDDFALTNPNFPSTKNVLMQTNSEFQLKTTRDGNVKILSYHILPKVNGLKEELVTVTEHGLVKSANEAGTCVILAKVVEEFGAVQQLSIVVEVKPVTFMMLNVLPAFQPADVNQELSFVPRGVSLPIELSFHDETGAKFDSISLETIDDIVIRPSRFDTNQIRRVDYKQTIQGVNTLSNNSTAEISCVMETVRDNTFTVLKAAIKSDGNSERNSKNKAQHPLQDFIVLDVQRAIQPSINRVIVGDVIAFESQIEVLGVEKNIEDYGDRWFTEPKGHINVDSKTGLMTAIKPGQVRIVYGSPNIKNSKTSVDIDIKPAGRPIILQDTSSKKTILTNKPDNIQYIPVVILGKENLSAANNELLQELGSKPGKNFHSVREKQLLESSGHEIEFKALEAETIFGCHARFLSLEHDLSNYLTVNAGFDESTGTYVCYFTPVEYENQMELALDVELSVTPGYSTGMEIGDRLQLSFVTAFKVLTTELALTNVQPTSHIEIKGLSTNLENVNVELSHPHLLKKGRGYIDSFDDSITDIGGYLQKYNLPITVKSAFWNGGKESLSANMYALISTESQSVKLPVVVRFRSDKCGNIDLGWSTVFYFLIDHYQSFLLILFSCFACTYITRVSSNHKFVNVFG